METAASDAVARLQAYGEAVIDTLCRQTSRAPLPITVSAAFVAWIAWTRGPPQAAIAAWFTLLTVGLIARWAFANRILRDGVQDARRSLRILLGFNAWNGIMAGSAAVLFMPGLALEWQAILTMILMAWASGSVTLSGASMRSFFCFTIPMAVLLASAWFAAGKGPLAVNAGTGLLIVLFFIVQTSFARHTERMFRNSFDMRYENARLVEELELQRSKVVEERDRAREANNSKSRFLADASHDLRQPLHSIAVSSAALSLRSADERTSRLAEDISEGIEQLKTLLDSLLDISKLDAGAVEPEKSVFEIRPLLASVAEDFREAAEKKGLALEVSAPADAFVCTDQFQLGRIVSNLIDNAVKYTMAGSVRVIAETTENEVTVRVVDTGIGIPETEQQHVFEEFLQLDNPARDHARGLGLGLAIVRRLARLLDTPLELRSRVGEGSTFSLRLPRVQPQSRAVIDDDGSIDDEQLRSVAGLHVLVVDDHPVTLRGMQALLENLECRVTTATSVGAALEAFERERPDVVITDYRLRGNETGLELIHEVQRRRGAVPTIVITGDTTVQGVDQLRAAEVPLLRKPVDVKQLVNHLKAITVT